MGGEVGAVRTLRALGTLGWLSLLWGFPLILVVLAVVMHSAVAWDFRAFYDAGHAYLHLRSPYVAPTLANLTTRQNFVYPLPVAAAFAPLSMLPYGVAAALFITVNAAALLLALRVLEIRDWRCYAVTLASFPGYFALKIGTLSPILALLLALLWRYRSRERIAVPVLSLLILAKLFLWPLAVWCLLARRFRMVALVAVVCVSAVALSTAPLGLSPLVHYPSLLHAVSDFEGPLTFSLVGLFTGFGLPIAAAVLMSFLVGAGLLLRAWEAMRAGDDALAFRAAVVAALAMSPILWNHYLLLLCVPLALYRPRFSILWFGCAWLGVDGFVVGRTTMTILTVVVWLIVPLQAGLIPRLRIPRRFVPRVRVAALAGLWTLLVVSLLLATRSIPVLAALRPPPSAAGASGSALLRIERDSTAVCWRVRTSGIGPDARAEIVRPGVGEVVAARGLGRAQGFDTCSRLASSAAARALRRAAGHDPTTYTIRIVGADGRTLLAGPIVRATDAGASHEQTAPRNRAAASAAG